MPIDRGYRGGASDYYGTGQSEQRRRDSAEMTSPGGIPGGEEDCVRGGRSRC